MLKENILIVDDEEDVLELVRFNLNKNGYRVETATTGEESLTKARAKLSNLVILDLMLPGSKMRSYFIILQMLISSRDSSAKQY